MNKRMMGQINLELMKAEKDSGDSGSTSKTTNNQSRKQNESLERESDNVLLYCACFLAVDVWKQISTYGMKYYNGGSYPLAQTQIVAVTEISKFVIFLVICLMNRSISSIKWSLWFAVPSFIYGVNNNIYFLGLRYTTPPIWNILIQLRIIFTALTYRLVFKKAITSVQWLGLSLLIMAIVLTNYASGRFTSHYDDMFIALALATFGSITSVIGTITMEYLFKNNVNSFNQMQLQLYLFGLMMCTGLYAIEYSTNPPAHFDGPTVLVSILLVVSIVMSILSGVAVAFIVKKLDNIVKLYSQALSNMLTSIACFLFFPDMFQLDLLFMFCLILMFVAVYVYEAKDISFKSIKQNIVSTFIGR